MTGAASALVRCFADEGANVVDVSPGGDTDADARSLKPARDTAFSVNDHRVGQAKRTDQAPTVDRWDHNTRSVGPVNPTVATMLTVPSQRRCFGLAEAAPIRACVPPNLL